MHASPSLTPAAGLGGSVKDGACAGRGSGAAGASASSCASAAADVNFEADVAADASTDAATAALLAASAERETQMASELAELREALADVQRSLWTWQLVSAALLLVSIVALLGIGHVAFAYAAAMIKAAAYVSAAATALSVAAYATLALLCRSGLSDGACYLQALLAHALSWAWWALRWAWQIGWQMFAAGGWRAVLVVLGAYCLFATGQRRRRRQLAAAAGRGGDAAAAAAAAAEVAAVRAAAASREVEMAAAAHAKEATLLAEVAAAEHELTAALAAATSHPRAGDEVATTTVVCEPREQADGGAADNEAGAVSPPSPPRSGTIADKQRVGLGGGAANARAVASPLTENN